MIRNLKSIFSLSLLTIFLLLSACKKDTVKPATTETVTPFPTAIGKPTGNAVTKEIGAAGGSVTSPDGKVTLTIPAGALSNTIPITIQPIENTTPNGIGSS